jgi:hypothetical protein
LATAVIEVAAIDDIAAVGSIAIRIPLARAAGETITAAVRAASASTGVPVGRIERVVAAIVHGPPIPRPRCALSESFLIVPQPIRRPVQAGVVAASAVLEAVLIPVKPVGVAFITVFIAIAIMVCGRPAAGMPSTIVSAPGAATGVERRAVRTRAPPVAPAKLIAGIPSSSTAGPAAHWNSSAIRIPSAATDKLVAAAPGVSSAAGSKLTTTACSAGACRATARPAASLTKQGVD